MHIGRPDETHGEAEWRPFVEAVGFGHLIAAGLGRRVPVVVPTQFLLEADEVLLHLVAQNPILAALAEQPAVVLSVAGDWAYVPSEWKAIGEEDPRLGIPTTYYAAVQLEGTAEVLADASEIAEVLRRQLQWLQSGVDVADPEAAHTTKLATIRALRIRIESVRAKFKYGGNVDRAHRLAVVERLRARAGPGDLAAAARVLERRLD